jgi:phenolic acid decarboxylase
VVPAGASTIDGTVISKHFRWVSKTYVASGGDWLIKLSEGRADNVFEVSETGSWTTIEEVLEFLDVHMEQPSVVRLVGGDYVVEATQTIDLPFPLTIQGSTYGAATITAGAGVSGSMFDCTTETYFKMLAFDAGGMSGIDAVHLTSTNEYYEIKDCTIDGFDKGIVALSNVEVWIFELDILNATTAGVEIAAGGLSGASLKISETDFINCGKGINLLSGTNPVVSILNCGFYNNSGGQIGINYVPATFTSLSRVFVTNNSWNNTGTFLSGFDFSLASGRDANTFIKNNSGGQDKNPHSRINVSNNVATTSIAVAGTWYKANWTAGTQTSITTKWTIGTNRITYQPVNKSDGWAIITGNITVPANNRTISIAIVKNGVTATRFGETDLRLTTASDPYQFATTIYLTDIGPGDYFEIYCTSATGGETATFRDVQWFTETK